MCAYSYPKKTNLQRKTIANPGAVGISFCNSGKTQFMMLYGYKVGWITEFITLPYNVEKAIQEMDEERLFELAPAWYRITKSILRGGNISHVTLITKARETCLRETGKDNKRDIPEEYWNRALSELGIE